MDGSEFIAFASKLSQQPANGPPCMRSAASRAYYGAYHLALAFLTRRGWHCTIDNQHKWVQWHFYNCKNATAKEVGVKLGNLHESRKDADYELSEAAADTQSNATTCVQRADEIQTMLLQCEDSTNLPSIIVEMTAYRKIQKWPT